MDVQCATAKARPVFEDEPQAWISVARFMHPTDGDEWVTVGAGATAEEAQRDLIALLREETGEAPATVSECVEERQRRALLWSAQSRAMLRGFPIAIVRD
jgi:hypothetical protein